MSNRNLFALGPHVFRVIGLNGQALETTSEASWAEFQRFGMVDGAHFTGMMRDTHVIQGVLFPDAIGGLQDYEAIRATQRQGKAVQLVSMGSALVGTARGLVTIERVSELREYGGRKVSFDIELRGYDIKDVFAEAKGNGFDVQALQHILKLRKEDEDARKELDAIVELYASALGMFL